MCLLSLKGAAACCVLLLLWGCAGRLASPPMGKDLSMPRVYRMGEIVETRSGRVLTLDQLIRELSGVQIVYVGETHVSETDHRVQEEILRRLHRVNATLALGMEMFTRESQPILDRFAAGATDEETLLREVDWSGTWGYPFSLYRPILMFAREKCIPILGLNAPRELVRRIGADGLQSLGPSDRERLAQDFHQDDPQHREYVRSQYAQHMTGGIGGFQSFFEAQLAWEETMAETLAHRLLMSMGKEQIVVLVGKGHVSHGVGLPKLVLKRLMHTYKIVVPLPINHRSGVADPHVADYVWVTETGTHPQRGRLGMMVRETASGEGLEVVSVLPGSPSERAGLKKGDGILAVDEVPMRALEDLHKAVVRAGDRFRMTVKRNGEVLSVTIDASQ